MTYTGSLIDELFALVKKAQESTGSLLGVRADSCPAKAADSESSVDSRPDLTVQTIPAGVSSGRG